MNFHESLFVSNIKIKSNLVSNETVHVTIRYNDALNKLILLADRSLTPCKVSIFSLVARVQILFENPNRYNPEYAIRQKHLV